MTQNMPVSPRAAALVCVGLFMVGGMLGSIMTIVAKNVADAQLAGHYRSLFEIRGQTIDAMRQSIEAKDRTINYQTNTIAILKARIGEPGL